MFTKLTQAGMSDKIVKAIKSTYMVVKSYIRQNGKTSDYINSTEGVLQGSPCSPLLFMMFVNDITHSINTNLDGIFTVEDTKLFILMYADDQVIFSTNAESLQSMLNDVNNYCHHSRLKINTSKTKIVIFEKCRQQTSYKFYLHGSELEQVSCFKYLGIRFDRNANWFNAQKQIAERGGFSLYKLFSLFSKVELPVSNKCKLFDTLVASVLNYGSEIWRYHAGKEVENVHIKFMRQILGVRKSTNLSGLYGELGRIPLFIFRKIHMIRYWVKILQSPETSLVKRVFNILRTDTDNANSHGNKNWAFHIKHILDSHGLSFFWIHQDTIPIRLETIQTRIIDQYKQSWYTNINNSQRLLSYSMIKHNFQFEEYLDKIINSKYRKALTRFRISAHKLRIETGRHDNTPRENRICEQCNTNTIENEYHFLLVCPRYRELRIKYIKRYFFSWPTTNKFETLLLSSNTKTISNVAKFIYHASTLR